MDPATRFFESGGAVIEESPEHAASEKIAIKCLFVIVVAIASEASFGPAMVLRVVNERIIAKSLIDTSPIWRLRDHKRRRNARPSDLFA
jgi:hypothetical protein